MFWRNIIAFVFKARVLVFLKDLIFHMLMADLQQIARA